MSNEFAELGLGLNDEALEAGLRQGGGADELCQGIMRHFCHLVLEKFMQEIRERFSVMPFLLGQLVKFLRACEKVMIMSWWVKNLSK